MIDEAGQIKKTVEGKYKRLKLLTKADASMLSEVETHYVLFNTSKVDDFKTKR